MAITKLQLYNSACIHLGERQLSSLTEEREPRRLLDAAYDRGQGFIVRCLSKGLWNFAMKATKMDASTSITPSFGYAYAFDKPSDYVRMSAISADENFLDPLAFYDIERAYFYADVDPIYIRYVSSDSSYGSNFDLWPETFSEWAGAFLATQIAQPLMKDKDYKNLLTDTRRMLIEARSIDAQEEPVRFPAQGTWTRARYGGRSRRDRGSRNSLIG